MPITAQLGDGSTLSIAGYSLGEIMSIKAGGGGYEAVDVSNLSTTGLRAFLQTLSYDGGELEVEYVANPFVAITTVGQQAFTITLPGSAGTITGYCFVLSQNHDIPMRQKITHSIKFKITASVS